MGQVHAVVCEENDRHKRSHPVPEQESQKQSPDAKVAKANEASVPTEASVRRALSFENKALGPAAEVQQDKSPAEKPLTQEPDSVPAKESPPPSAVANNETNEQSLLRKALDKIAALEKALETKTSQNTDSQPTSALATPQNKTLRPMETPSTTPSTQSKQSITHDSQEGEGEGEEGEPSSGDVMEFPNGSKVITQDALRMRLRRLCEKKAKSGKCHVDNSTMEAYLRGGEEREWLEIALVEALQKTGADAKCHKKLRAAWS